MSDPSNPDRARKTTGLRYVASAVARDRDLRRVELAFLAFNMSEYATWIALLVFAYARGARRRPGSWR